MRGSVKQWRPLKGSYQVRTPGSRSESLAIYICASSLALSIDKRNTALCVLTELETISMDCGLEENLALITCGRDTRVVQHLTNDYQLFRQSLGKPTTSLLG